jgi:hypothetical protein
MRERPVLANLDINEAARTLTGGDWQRFLEEHRFTEDLAHGLELDRKARERPDWELE